MPRLVASDLDQVQIHYKWSLEEGVGVPLGRSVAADQLRVDWDNEIAPRQAVLRWHADRLYVERASEAPPDCPIFYAGGAADSFQIIPGEGFVIGRTVFRLEPLGSGGSSLSPSPPPEPPGPDTHTMPFDPSEDQVRAIR